MKSIALALAALVVAFPAYPGTATGTVTRYITKAGSTTPNFNKITFRLSGDATSQPTGCTNHYFVLDPSLPGGDTQLRIFLSVQALRQTVTVTGTGVCDSSGSGASDGEVHRYFDVTN